jgi:hypothetical protein
MPEETSVVNPAKALRALCETLLDYPEGIDDARLRARLRLPVWLYDDVAEEAVEHDLAEEATVFVGSALVIAGRRLPGREKAGLKPTDTTKGFVLGEPQPSPEPDKKRPAWDRAESSSEVPNKKPRRRQSETSPIDRLWCTLQAIHTFDSDTPGGCVGRDAAFLAREVAEQADIGEGQLSRLWQKTPFKSYGGYVKACDRQELQSVFWNRLVASGEIDAVARGDYHDTDEAEFSAPDWQSEVQQLDDRLDSSR